MVKGYNKMTKPKETPAATDPPDVKLLTEIRDLLKAQQAPAAKTSA